jgi:transcription antitermination factor NusG
MRWIVVRVKSQQIQIAIKNLEQSGFNCYCPYLNIQEKGKVTRTPMFSGYIFVEIDPKNINKWKKINSHRGVLRMLMSTSGYPGTLPIGFVETMMGRGETWLHLDRVIKLHKGQQIRFTAGQFSGIGGIVQWTNKERIALLINLLGQETVVQSTTNLVAPVELVV